MCIDMCIDMCINMCIDMCIDMYLDTFHPETLSRSNISMDLLCIEMYIYMYV